MLHDRLISAEVEKRDELGGHSSVWALRAQMEECRIFIRPSPSEFNNENLKFSDEVADRFLLNMSADKE